VSSTIFRGREGEAVGKRKRKKRRRRGKEGKGRTITELNSPLLFESRQNNILITRVHYFSPIILP